MVIGQFIRSQEQLEDEIRQDVIEVRRFLPQSGYREVTIFKEGRRGLLYCALWERTGEPNERPGAVGYGRVSTILQSDNHSLVTQIRQQLELAGERGHVIRYIYIDAGFTGRDDRRPAFSHMIQHIARDNKQEGRKANLLQLHLRRISLLQKSQWSDYPLRPPPKQQRRADLHRRQAYRLCLSRRKAPPSRA